MFSLGKRLQTASDVWHMLGFSSVVCCLLQVGSAANAENECPHECPFNKRSANKQIASHLIQIASFESCDSYAI